MPRLIVYDATHLVSRLAARTLTGIDRVDLAFGQHIAGMNSDGLAAHCRSGNPLVIAPDMLRRIVDRAHVGSWEHASLDDDDNFTRVRDWLDGGEPGRAAARKLASPQRRLGQRIAGRAWRAHCRVAPVRRDVPPDAVYLNIAEHWLEHRYYFRWLASRRDVQAVFFVHDLLPMDYPEYFRPDYDAVFNRRFETLATYGTAFIVSTDVVRERLNRALAESGRPAAPVHVAPLPSPLALGDDEAAGERPAPAPPTHPYFVLVSTVEPRKNHLLILNLWRELAVQFGDATPRLLLIGSRGWEDEQIIDMLDRCDGIARHVLRSARISRQGLTWLVKHARALLMPSFDEGYGLPVVEALSLGTPVIAADTPTFREVTRGCATLLSPIDGAGWRDAIVALAAPDLAAWQQAKDRAAPFCPPGWDGYFRGVDDFLHSLP